MDQVKVYLGVAKKHHFWILAGIVVIVSIVVWMMGASSLAALYSANKLAIDGAKKGLEETQRSDELANPLFTKKVEGLHDELKQQVFEAWQTLYKRQVGLLRWPNLDVGEGNTFNIGDLKPTEQIPDRYCSIYNETVLVDQWKQLFDQLRLRRQVVPEQDEDSEDRPATVGTLGGPVNYEGVVVWDEDLRQAVIDRYYTRGVPSTTKVRLSQEDFWLFKSLVWIINTVNGEDATDPLKAKIKEIQDLDVAQWAVAAAQTSAKDSGKPRRRSGGTGGGMGPMGPGGSGGAMHGPMGPGGSGGAMHGPMGPGGGMQGPMGPGGPAGNKPPTPPGAAGGNNPQAAAGAETEKDPDAELRDGRYLDEKGQPLAAGAPEPFAEFKQVFVFMKLTMDQRAIPELIAACANAPLPVETRQVTVRMLDEEGVGGGIAFGAQSGGVDD